MTLGTGIFLSAIFIGIIYLFVSTKDRWKWKKIILWSVGGTVGIIVLIFLGLWGWDYYKNLPIKQTELSGIKLGTIKDDVRFLLGKPKKVIVGKTTKNKIWLYEKGKIYTHVRFSDNDIVSEISVTCVAEYKWRCPEVNGVNKGIDSESILNRLGEPSSIEKGGEGSVRLYEYKHLNSYFILWDNYTYEVGIYDPNMFDPEIPEFVEFNESSIK